MKTDKLLNFKFLEDIAYYDGPLISLGLTQDNSPVLQIWCDENLHQNFNIYVYAYIQLDDFTPLINGEKSYFNVLKDSIEIILFKYNGAAFDFEVISNQDYLAEYGPKEHSSLENDLIEFRPKLEAFMTTQKENKE